MLGDEVFTRGGSPGSCCKGVTPSLAPPFSLCQLNVTSFPPICLSATLFLTWNQLSTNFNQEITLSSFKLQVAGICPRKEESD